MRGRHKNGLSADPVHVDARARLKVIKMDVAVFGDEKDDIMLGAYLEREEKDHVDVYVHIGKNDI